MNHVDQYQICIKSLSQVIQQNNSKIGFYGEYRFPLFGLDQELGINISPALVETKSLEKLLENASYRSDFYWLMHHKLVSIKRHASQRGIDNKNKKLFLISGTASKLKKLVAMNCAKLAELIRRTIQDTEAELGINHLTAYEKSRFLKRYGFCAKANHQILTKTSAIITDDSYDFVRPKIASVRLGSIAEFENCKRLISSVFAKQERKIRFFKHKLFRRVTPSVGSLCSVEAILLHAKGFWLYESSNDKFVFLSEIDGVSTELINADIWLNCGNISTQRASAVLLFASQDSIKFKYGELSDYLQSVEAGLLLGDLWQVMPSCNLCGCILGNPMSGLLSKYLHGYFGHVLPMAGLMLFDANSTSS